MRGRAARTQSNKRQLRCRESRQVSGSLGKFQALIDKRSRPIGLTSQPDREGQESPGRGPLVMPETKGEIAVPIEIVMGDDPSRSS